MVVRLTATTTGTKLVASGNLYRARSSPKNVSSLTTPVRTTGSRVMPKLGMVLGSMLKRFGNPSVGGNI